MITHVPDEAEQKRIRDELRQVAEQGVAINRGDTLPDLHAVSTPVFEHAAVAAVITVAGPSTRFTTQLDQIVHATLEAARRATRD